jgi:hypothetical protein
MFVGAVVHEAVVAPADAKVIGLVDPALSPTLLT